MNSAFAEWVNQEVDRRGWSLRHVAEMGGITHTPIIRVANGQQPATYEVCMALAKAFAMRPEDVLRTAGLLPSNHIRQRKIVYQVNADERLLELWRGLGAEDQSRILDMLERLQAPLEPRIVGEAPPDANA